MAIPITPVGVSGSGTTGILPIWLTSTSIADSKIQDGIAAGILTVAKAGVTARTATFPDAAVLVTGSAVALTANRLPKGTATSGVAQDSQIADTVTGGVLTLAGTLTVPRTKTLQNTTATIAELETAETLTGAKTFQNALPITARQGATTDAIVVAPANVGAGSNKITDTTPSTALGADFIQTRQAATGTVPLIEIQPCASFQNKLINPRFDIWQRGTSFAPTLNTETYDADRFFTQIDGTSLVFTVSQQTHTLGALADEPTYFRRCAVTTAGTVSTVTKILAQRIEGVRTFAGKRVIVAFKAKADAARTITPNYVQSFGTGGAPSANVAGAGTGIALTTSWATYTQVITLPSISGKTMGTTIGTDYLELWLSAAANTVQTIDISDIEVKEVAASGQVNTPFEIRTLVVEIALCQRYYETSNPGSPYASNDAYVVSSIIPPYHTFNFKTGKRAVPTLAFATQTGSGAVFVIGRGAFFQDIANTTPSQFGWAARSEL